jgi:TRAP-type mannitol/chloroaromatic compound transport system permease large subunit
MMEFLSDHAGLIAILLMFTLMLLSVPVFVATGVGALIGFLLIRDPDQAVHDMGDIVWAGAAIYELVALPLFIFTGLLMQRIGAGEDLFNVTRAWVGASRNSLGWRPFSLAEFLQLFAAQVLRPRRRSESLQFRYFSVIATPRRKLVASWPAAVRLGLSCRQVFR